MPSCTQPESDDGRRNLRHFLMLLIQPTVSCLDIFNAVLYPSQGDDGQTEPGIVIGDV